MTDPHFALSLCFRAGQIFPGRDLDIGVISLGQLHRAAGQLKQTAIIRDEPCLFRVQRGQRLQVRRTLKALRRLHCIQGAAIRRSLYHAVRGHDASIPGQCLLDRILDRHCRSRCPLLCSGQQHRLDHSLADKWAGCVVDSHQLAVCCQHPVFGAFCPGGSAIHHLYRLAAQAGLLLQLCAVFARHQDQLAHQRTAVKGADAAAQHRLAPQVRTKFVKSHPGGGPCRHQNRRYAFFHFVTLLRTKPRPVKAGPKYYIHFIITYQPANCNCL